MGKFNSLEQERMEKRRHLKTYQPSKKREEYIPIREFPQKLRTTIALLSLKLGCTKEEALFWMADLILDDVHWNLCHKNEEFSIVKKVKFQR